MLNHFTENIPALAAQRADDGSGPFEIYTSGIGPVHRRATRPAPVSRRLCWRAALFQTPDSTLNLSNVTIFRHPTIKICTIAVKWPPLIAVKRHEGSRESLVYFMGLRQSLLFPGGVSARPEKRERVTLDDVQTVVGS